ncbi:MAG: RluA family pseudouridine synthase [Flavobacteriia bacterium]|nr:RluA family pseudouridine synthase [Flavobacteriia bacterium]
METLVGKSRDNIKSLLKKKLVEVEGKVETKYNHALKPGQKVTIRPKAGSIEQKKYTGIEIVFEDKDLIVINKDAGLLTIATNKETKKTAFAILSEHVKKKNPANKIFIVHRLDRETSGLLLFAKNEEIKAKLQENWNDTILERTYLALVEGKLEKSSGVHVSYLIESPSSLLVHSSQNASKGQKAVTHYKTIVSKKGVSLMEVNLETGRKNQIRVHFQDLKHPIVGDKKYGATNHSLGRLGLHAKVLAFTHPKTGKVVRFESEIPKKFLKLL